MTNNPGGLINNIYLLMWRLANHAVFNISITGVNALSNEMIIDIIFAVRMAHNFILKISFEAWPWSFTLHSLVARQQELPCDLSKK